MQLKLNTRMGVSSGARSAPVALCASAVPRRSVPLPRTRLSRSSSLHVRAQATLAVAGGDGQRGPSAASHAPVPLSKFDGEIMSVALPALASMLLEPIMGVINSGMVGNLGTQQLGAVSVASMAVSFSTFLFSFLLFLTTPEIAAAVVKGDRAEVSKISARSFWVAGLFGSLTSLALVLGGPTVVKLMAPPEAAVAQYATEYIGIRAWGILAALFGFVATGTYRGFKDTSTPLYAAVGSATASAVFNYLFIYVFQWGVKGSALAVTLAQGVSTTVLCVLLVYKRMLRIEDLATVPTWASVEPMLRKGLVLGLRNVISFGMVLYASLMCVRAGSAYQASFEVVRQVWILTIQTFECFNVATQTLCASYLGAKDRASASAVMNRLLQLGVGMGAVMGVLVFALQLPIVTFFTKDPIVIAQVLATLPMVCLLFPLDAAASIFDGSLLAARQTDYMSVTQIIGSVFQFGALLYIGSQGNISSLTIWATLKVLTFVRCGSGFHRNWISSKSAYKPLASTPMSAASPAVAADSSSTKAEPVSVAPVPVPAPTHSITGVEAFERQQASPVHAVLHPPPAHTSTAPAQAPPTPYQQQLQTRLPPTHTPQQALSHTSHSTASTSHTSNHAQQVPSTSNHSSSSSGSQQGMQRGASGAGDVSAAEALGLSSADPAAAGATVTIAGDLAISGLSPVSVSDADALLASQQHLLDAAKQQASTAAAASSAAAHR